MSVPKVVSPRTYSSFVIVIFDLFSRFFFQIVDVKDAVPNLEWKKYRICSSIWKMKMKKSIFRNFCRIDIIILQFDKQHLTIDLAKFDDICAKRNVFMGAKSKPYSSLHNPLTYMVCLHSILFKVYELFDFRLQKRCTY